MPPINVKVIEGVGTASRPQPCTLAAGSPPDLDTERRPAMDNGPAAADVTTWVWTEPDAYGPQTPNLRPQCVWCKTTARPSFRATPLPRPLAATNEHPPRPAAPLSDAASARVSPALRTPLTVQPTRKREGATHSRRQGLTPGQVQPSRPGRCRTPVWPG